MPRQFKDLLLVDNWSGSLALIIACLILSFLLFGYWWPYWRAADMDIWLVNDGWLLNDGLPQERFEHPGYLSILLLGHWFGLLHQLGLLDVDRIALLPPPAAAEHAWTAAVRAGRVLSLLLVIAFVLSFAVLLRRLIGNWRVAVVATLLLTFSGGVAMQARILRTELIAGALVIIGLLILLNAARTPQSAWRPLLVGLAALLATLGLTNKVQMIFLISALPLIVLPFGCRSSDPATFWRSSRFALPGSALIAAAAVLLAIPAASLVRFGIAHAAPYLPVPFLLGTHGVYQAALAAWIVLAMIGFARLWQVPRLELLAALGAVAGGVALGLLALELRYAPLNVIVVMNPLENLVAFAQDHEMAAGAPTAGGLLRSIMHGLGVVLATRTFVLDTSARPGIFLEWFVIVAAIVTWKAGNRLLVLQAAVLVGVGWAMDAIYAARGLVQQYFTLTDPLIIIAAAWLVARAPALQTHKWIYPIGTAVILVHLILGQFEPIEHTFQTDTPLMFCVKRPTMPQRIESFSFCAPGA